MIVVSRRVELAYTHSVCTREVGKDNASLARSRERFNRDIKVRVRIAVLLGSFQP